jgi:hypothetical protein
VLLVCCQAPSDEDEEDSDFRVVHGPVGDSAADLPPATQKILAALQHNQAQLDALAEQWQQARSKLKAEQSKLRVKLAQERRCVGAASRRGCLFAMRLCLDLGCTERALTAAERTAA